MNELVRPTYKSTWVKARFSICPLLLAARRPWPKRDFMPVARCAAAVQAGFACERALPDIQLPLHSVGSKLYSCIRRGPLWPAVADAMSLYAFGKEGE